MFGVSVRSVPLRAERLRQAEDRLAPHPVVGDRRERPPHRSAELGGECRNRTGPELREVLEPRANHATPLICRQHSGHIAASRISRGGRDCGAKLAERDRCDPSSDARDAKHGRRAFAFGRCGEPLLDAEQTVERMQVAVRELEGSLLNDRTREEAAVWVGGKVGFCGGRRRATNACRSAARASARSRSSRSPSRHSVSMTGSARASSSDQTSAASTNGPSTARSSSVHSSAT